VADEMLQSRLPLATGQGLRALAASKFFADVVDVPTKAIGQVALRSTTTNNTIGTIPAGTRFRRQPNPRAQPVPILGADFLSLVDVRVVSDGTTNWLIPIQCVSTGPAGNILIEHAQPNTPSSQLVIGNDLQVVDNLFDAFSVVSATAAGGGTTFSDVEVRRIAGAQPQGRRGPTLGAIYAGSYLATGVRHVAAFEDTDAANTLLFVADESWCSDVNYWQPAVIQTLQDSWAGFGCSLQPNNAGFVDNYFLNVAATVQLRSQQLLQSSNDVKAAIIAKLNAYFNDRNDWYTFRASAIRAVIARADPRVFTCTSVTITDRWGNSVPDPPLIVGVPTILRYVPALAQFQTLPGVTHYDLLSFTPTFVPPV
jgi:hypothetical protein